MQSLRLETGSQVELGAVLAKAGEGTIYDIAGRPEWAAKIFHPTLNELHTKLAKVAAMVQSTPVGSIQPDGFVVLTWPLHTVSDPTGPVGYVMPKLDTATSVEIHTVSNPSNRLNPLPTAPQWTRNATWGHLLNVAANLCLAVEAVHRVDAVIGDFQERNILVANTTRVTLVDCDSMQFTDRSGTRFLCAVGRPEFTAPELADANLRIDPREKPSDLFALAVHIHLLLMAGNHPFLRGTWTGDGEQPDALTLARAGQWAGGPSSPLRAHPLAPPVTSLPLELRQLFVRAFSDGVHDPSLRPTGTEWRQALSRVQVLNCPNDPAHQFPVGADACPWCAIDRERQARRQSGYRTGTIPLARQPTPAPRVAAGASQGAWAQLSPGARTYLAVLFAVVLVVVVVAVAFVVWALTLPASRNKSDGVTVMVSCSTASDCPGFPSTASPLSLRTAG
jgi:DNA-binding helix-hairpin-helix protein with protein kinase domain